MGEIVGTEVGATVGGNVAVESGVAEVTSVGVAICIAGEQETNKIANGTSKYLLMKLILAFGGLSRFAGL